MKMIENKICILPNSVKKITDGGIHLPDSHIEREKVNVGQVLFVGPGIERMDGSIKPMIVSPNDLVAYPNHSGSDVKVGDLEYRIIRESDILFIFD